MHVELSIFEDFSVEVIQETMSKSTLHVSIMHNGDEVNIFMPQEKIEQLANKIKEALDKYRSF